jgi:hypothetical protein
MSVVQGRGETRFIYERVVHERQGEMNRRRGIAGNIVMEMFP